MQDREEGRLRSGGGGNAAGIMLVNAAVGQRQLQAADNATTHTQYTEGGHESQPAASLQHWYEARHCPRIEIVLQHVAAEKSTQKDTRGRSEQCNTSAQGNTTNTKSRRAKLRCTAARVRRCRQPLPPQHAVARATDGYRGRRRQRSQPDEKQSAGSSTGQTDSAGGKGGNGEAVRRTARIRASTPAAEFPRRCPCCQKKGCVSRLAPGSNR
jgi:hypothetical protein